MYIVKVNPDNGMVVGYHTGTLRSFKAAHNKPNLVYIDGSQFYHPNELETGTLDIEDFVRNYKMYQLQNDGKLKRRYHLPK